MCLHDSLESPEICLYVVLLQYTGKVRLLWMVRRYRSRYIYTGTWKMLTSGDLMENSHQASTAGPDLWVVEARALELQAPS